MAERRGAIDPSMSDNLETLDELQLETKFSPNRSLLAGAVLILDAEPSTSADPAGDVR
jgi:hypothetical protein